MSQKSLNLNESERLNRIVSAGEAEIRKPRLEKKFLNVFISEDADSVGEYLVWKVIVPAIQGMLRDAGHGIVDTVFGTGGRGNTNYSGRYEGRRNYERSSYGYTDYSSNYYNGGYASSYRNNRRYDSRDTEVVFRSRAKADECRDTLDEIISRKGCASVNHLSELIGVDYDKAGDEEGWYNIARSRIRSTRDGYVLELPRPEFIEERDRWWERR